MIACCCFLLTGESWPCSGSRRPGAQPGTNPNKHRVFQLRSCTTDGQQISTASRHIMGYPGCLSSFSYRVRMHSSNRLAINIPSTLHVGPTFNLSTMTLLSLAPIPIAIVNGDLLAKRDVSLCLDGHDRTLPNRSQYKPS